MTDKTRNHDARILTITICEAESRRKEGSVFVGINTYGHTHAHMHIYAHNLMTLSRAYQVSLARARAPLILHIIIIIIFFFCLLPVSYTGVNYEVRLYTILYWSYGRPWMVSRIKNIASIVGLEYKQISVELAAANSMFLYTTFQVAGDRYSFSSVTTCLLIHFVSRYVCLAT